MGTDERSPEVGFYRRTENQKIIRFRRLRMTEALRPMVRETKLSKNDFI
jgi:delta-aminolevulinic acid dehydratase/porphobilinogen synthase